MGTKIGIIAEGPIDEALLPPLLDQIARQRVGFTWPIIPDDLGRIIMTRRRGQGGVLTKVKHIIDHLTNFPPANHAFFVILLDRNTYAVQDEIKKLIQGNPLFAMGIAIEEIEAWWLADKRNLYEFLGIKDEHCTKTRYGQERYSPEKDTDPKKTLDELTRLSPSLRENYGNGNTSLANEFAEEYWKGRVNLDAIEQSCPKGFVPFCKHITQSLQQGVSRQKSQ